MKHYIARLTRLLRLAGHAEAELEQIKINQGKLLVEMHRGKTSDNLADFEFKVFSQWGEDGIIQRLIAQIEIPNKTFIEFGVEDFSESNCRFLLMNNNWSGFVIDGSAGNIKTIKTSYYYWRYDLEAVEAFITKENINELLRQSGFDTDLGILSIDIDGVDYWILEAIDSYAPRILILEYNCVLGPDRTISVPYDADFRRTAKHASNLYYGASLPALASLASKKGYSLVGTNSAGNNAFFVRTDLVNASIKAVPVSAVFTYSKYRESRAIGGALTHVRGHERAAIVRGMPVINVETGQTETL